MIDLDQPTRADLDVLAKTPRERSRYHLVRHVEPVHVMPSAVSAVAVAAVLVLLALAAIGGFR